LPPCQNLHHGSWCRYRQGYLLLRANRILCRRIFPD